MNCNLQNTRKAIARLDPDHGSTMGRYAGGLMLVLDVR